MKLLPHQKALLETFFNPASKRVILLRGDVGLGKGAALVALVGRLLQERSTARVLFIVPGAVRSQFVEMLRETGTPALLVDRYRFREMLDSATETEIWPQGVAVVLSHDFAKQQDILDSLAESAWDLVIADEAHSIRGARAEILRKVGACAERIILATATPQDLEAPDVFPGEDATVVEWRRDRVVDHDGNPLTAVPRPVLHEVPFSLSAAELDLRRTVGDLCEILGGATGAQGLRATALLRSLESSPAALEGVLERLTGGLGTQEIVDTTFEASEEEMPDDSLVGTLDRATAEKVAGIIARALQEIEAIGVDSKLSAFSQLLSDLSKVKVPSRRICVLTQYLGTLYYLATEIKGLGIACHLLRGGMSIEDRLRSLTIFTNEGGILLATSAVMTEGLSLAEVTDLILYDIPHSKNALQQVMGRFDRFGRLSELNLHVLLPADSPDGVIRAPTTILHELSDMGTKP